VKARKYLQLIERLKKIFSPPSFTKKQFLTPEIKPEIQTEIIPQIWSP